MSWIVLLGQQTVDKAPSLWPSYGTIGVAVVAIGYLALRLIRQENRQSRTFWTMADYELRVAKRENRVCNRRMQMLLEVLRENGIPVSDEVWTRPEAEEPEVQRPDGIDG